MTKNEIVQEAVNVAPPASVAGMTLAGVAMSDWVLIATLVYLVMQITWFVYSKAKALHDGSN